MKNSTTVLDNVNHMIDIVWQLIAQNKVAINSPVDYIILDNGENVTHVRKGKRKYF